MRIEPAGPTSINLVFRGDDAEQSWRLDRTTLGELIALMFRGRMRGGRQVVLPETEITMEPPEEGETRPMLRLAAKPVEICISLGGSGIEALKAGIERSLREN